MRQIKQFINRITPEKIWIRLFNIRRFVRKNIRKTLKSGEKIKRYGYFYLTLPYRMATAKKRALPDFLIIGTVKGGTTSLRAFLSPHPQIHMAPRELRYFNKEPNYQKGELWYLSHFPLRSSINPGDLVGEKTPGYLFSSSAAKRIQKDLPNAKLICLLRNPTERAISHYFYRDRVGPDRMAVRNRKEHRLIMDAMLAKEEAIPEPSKLPAYKCFGLYLEQLKYYESYLKDNRLLVLSSEEFFVNPQKVLKQVFKFLGVDETFKCPDLSPINVGKNKTPVPNEVYKYLNEYFKPHNQQLYNYLNRDFGW